MADAFQKGVARDGQDLFNEDHLGCSGAKRTDRLDQLALGELEPARHFVRKRRTATEGEKFVGFRFPAIGFATPIYEMNQDQFVYQQATRVCGIGLLVQFALGLFLLLLGQSLGDTSFIIASAYVFTGLVSWLALTVVFHQHRLERIEALENDEIAARRGTGVSVFQGEQEPSQAAAHRLRLMHQWLMPISSLIIAIALGGLAWATLKWLARLDDSTGNATSFQVGQHLGWQLAICTACALLTFIFSRFIAGMSRQPVWQNLRGGAGVMVGNAIVLLAIAVGVVFQVFRKPEVIEGVAFGIAVFIAVIAGEITLNLILNLYRPRRSTEVPRPAFDSKLLGLASAPDSIVRTINEAVNYQFGFDITSSWGYQLLLRSFLRLSLLGVAILLLMSMVVVVQPGEQAVRLRSGRVIGDVAQGSLVFKWPWPFETVERYDIGQVRTLVLGAKLLKTGEVNLWPVEGEPDSERLPFIVLANSQTASSELTPVYSDQAQTPQADAADVARVSSLFALVDADIVVEYRVKQDGLLDYLEFTSDIRSRRSQLDMRERTLKALALREASQLFSTRSIDQILSPTGDSLVRQLKDRIQSVFNEHRSGVEVVGVLVPVLRPPAGESAGMFEELSIDVQNSRKVVDEARRIESTTLSTLVGTPEVARAIVAQIDELAALERDQGADSPTVMSKRAAIEKVLVDAGAQAASVISRARAKRWDMLMRARATASDVAGQAPSYRAAPELFRERAIMSVLSRALAAARIKYVLAVDPAKVDFDVQMEQPEPGLNLGDYLEKKDAK